MMCDMQHNSSVILTIGYILFVQFILPVSRLAFCAIRIHVLFADPGNNTICIQKQRVSMSVYA